MPVHVDETLPLHPLSVTDVIEMVRIGILDEDDHVELLDGVLVEMLPLQPPHAYAIRSLAAITFPVAAAAGLELSIQAPLDVGSPISCPSPMSRSCRQPGATSIHATPCSSSRWAQPR
jgi:hypothetical protein